MISNKFGTIAAGHEETAKAGATILRTGGNAYDAAVAAMLASFVCESASISAGGGGFLLAHTAEEKTHLFDFFTQTPRAKFLYNGLDFYKVTINFGDSTQDFHIGLASIAVPGCLAGAFKVHQRLGKLPFFEVALPAIELAKKGLKLDRFQHRLLDLLEPIVKESDIGKQVFTKDGEQLKAVGDHVKIPDLGETLYMLAKDGIREFYEGEIAQRLVKDCYEEGGYITMKDMTGYQVIERQALQTDYRHYTLFTNPPPSGGGTLIAFALKMMEKYGIPELQWGSKAHIELLTSIMNITDHARKIDFDNRIYHPKVLDILFEAENMQYYANKLGSTTQISVIDKAGNVASVTTSAGEGAGYFIPGTGIMMNNMLGEEDLNPNGFHNWIDNQRISSMMAPSILVNRSGAKYAIGSSGSNRIRTAILQSISNIVDFEMPLDQAIQSSRIHAENKKLNLEPDFPEALYQQLQLKAGWEKLAWRKKSMFFGGVNAVGQLPKGAFVASADARRFGTVMD